MPLSWFRDSSTGRIQLSGVIDEHASLGALGAFLRPGDTLDLAGIARVNSAGVREWLGFMKVAVDQGLSLAFERCSIAMVSQRNLVADFFGPFEVRSFFVPYACPSCEKTLQREMRPGPTVRNEAAEGPFCECGQRFELDELLEQYLSFLPRTEKPGA